MQNHHVQWENPLFLWPFSIVIWVNYNISPTWIFRPFTFIKRAPPCRSEEEPTAPQADLLIFSWSCQLIIFQLLPLLPDQPHDRLCKPLQTWIFRPFGDDSPIHSPWFQGSGEQVSVVIKFTQIVMLVYQAGYHIINHYFLPMIIHYSPSIQTTIFTTFQRVPNLTRMRWFGTCGNPVRIKTKRKRHTRHRKKTAVGFVWK